MQFGSYRFVSPQTLQRRHWILFIGIALMLVLLYWLFFVKGLKHTVACTEKTFTCAVEKMFRAGVVDTANAQDAQLDNLLDRQTAAKMFAKLENYLHPLKDIPHATCTFEDEAYIDAAYKNYVQEACYRKIMRGSNGRFYPKANLTTAEVAVILSHMENKTVESAGTGKTWFAPYQNYAAESNFSTYMPNTDVTIDDKTPVSMGWLVAVLANYADGQMSPIK